MAPRRCRTSPAGPALAATAAVAALLGAACSPPAGPPDAGASSRSATSSASAATTSTSSGPSSTPSSSPSSTPSTPSSTPDAAAAVLAHLSLAQQVGQLVMVGGEATGVGRTTLDAISRRHVGNAMLTGRTTRGVAATARVSARLQARATAAATAGVPLLVATDQEGGQVQVLRGTGFSDIPTGVEQGTWSTSTLQARARTWGAELRAAGVRVDLAPVADTVPAATASSNAPIGHFHRELGHDPATVGAHVQAFVRGLAAAGVLTTPKHFPGLGRVRDNTDTTAGVTDHVTTRTSSYLDPWRQALTAGARAVMVSSAVYSRIDPDHPACFSRTVVTGVLRGDLGFDGVVISDDLGQARAVRRWSAGSRATQFVAAGGDLVLTVDPRQAAPMVDALLARARASSAFRAQVRASALRVLRLKQAAGLLG